MWLGDFAPSAAERHDEKDDLRNETEWNSGGLRKLARQERCNPGKGQQRQLEIVEAACEAMANIESDCHCKYHQVVVEDLRRGDQRGDRGLDFKLDKRARLG